MRKCTLSYSRLNSKLTGTHYGLALGVHGKQPSWIIRSKVDGKGAQISRVPSWAGFDLEEHAGVQSRYHLTPFLRGHYREMPFRLRTHHERAEWSNRRRTTGGQAG